MGDRKRRTEVVRALLTVALLALPGVPPGLSALSADRPSPVGAGAAVPPARTPIPAAAVAHGPAPGVAHRILTSLAAAHVPASVAYLPNLNARESVRYGTVTPLYTGGPAPVGVATLGVNGSGATPTAYALNSSSIEGTIQLANLSVLSLADGAPDFLGAQLNAVLTNVTLLGTPGYVFWTQNVVRYSNRSHLLEFVDNVWNFSDPGLALSANVFNSTGPTGVQVGSSFYYGLGPVLNISLPFTVHLYLNATRPRLSAGPYDEVWFNYSVVGPAGPVAHGSYDQVIFNSQDPSAPVLGIPSPVYLVEGSGTTPTGYLPYDAEMVLGGPGSGSTTSVYAINGTVALDFLKGGTYHPPPSAINFGSDSGETLEGLAEWYDRTETVHLGAGPTLPTPFWASSPTAQAGSLTITGTASPIPAFLFVCPTHRFDNATAAWGPTAPNGSFAFQLPSGPYEVAAMLSGYDTRYFAISGTQPSSWAIAPTLTADASVGTTTPLVARSDAQLGALAIGGSGTPGAPYRLFNRSTPTAGLAPVFGVLNGFGYPQFPGLLLEGTRAPAELDAPPSFNVTYTGSSLNLTVTDGLPATNQLPLWLDDARNLTIWGAASVGGWFDGALDGMPEADLVLWNCSSVLVGNDVFTGQGSSALVFGGGGIVVWGNRFDLGAMRSSEYNATDPTGLQVYGSGDTVYNNAFTVPVPALSPGSTIYTETLNGSTAARFVNDWNLSVPEPATFVRTVRGHALSGSIVGGTTEGGNYWWNYGNASDPLDRLPYDDGGRIAVGGDAYPLFGEAQGGLLDGNLSFVPSGLPAGLRWNVTVNGVRHSTVAAGLTLPEVAGWYRYSADAGPGFDASPSAGVVPVDGTTVTVPLAFSTVGPPRWGLTVEVVGYGDNVTLRIDGAVITGAVTFGSSLPNGTYAYSVDGVPGYDGPPPGRLLVAGPTRLTLPFVAHPGWITGVISPASATLRVNGSWWSVDHGSYNVSLAPGTYRLDVTAPGFEPANATVEVRSDVALVEPFQLAPLPPGGSGPTVAVRFLASGLPEGADWSASVDGAGGPWSVNATGPTLILPSGDYSATATGPDGYRWLSAGRMGFAVPGDVPGIDLTLAFAPLPGTLTVTVDPATARVLVGQQPWPLVGGRVEGAIDPGSYELAAAAPGFRTAFANVSVAPGGTSNVSLVLAPAGPSGPGPGTGSTPPMTVLLGAAAGLAVLGVALFVLWRRPLRAAPRTAPGAPPGPTTAPAAAEPGAPGPGPGSSSPGSAGAVPLQGR